MSPSRIDIRLPLAEKHALLDKANEAGLSLSVYLRRAAISAQVISETRKVEQLKQLRFAVGRVCGNLHALAKFANFNKHHIQSSLILRKLEEIEKIITRLSK